MDLALPAGLVVAGLVVGFTAGLVGIGGGVLMVPLLYFIYDGPGAAWGWSVAPSIEATVAHATSLFVIVPTAVVGAMAYSRAGLVAWRVALPIGAFSILGGIAGARVAILLPADVLKLAFGLFLVGTAAQLVRQPAGAADRPLRLSLRVTAPVGLLVGAFSAVLGVGGGLVAIPLMLHIVGLEIRKVAATSLAVIVFAASAGTLTYMEGGRGLAGLPAASLGYVHALAAVPLMIGSVLTVQLGARANQRMEVRALRWMFAALLLVLGLRLIAVGSGLG